MEINKFIFVLILILISSGVYASDLNYSNPVDVSFEINVIVNHDSNTVTIELPNKTEVIGTNVNTSRTITDKVSYIVTDSVCPDYSQITDPILETLDNLNLYDLNDLVQYVKDANTYSESCVSTLDQKVNQLDNSLQGLFDDFQAFSEETLVPVQADFDSLKEELEVCNDDMKDIDTNYQICLGTQDSLHSQINSEKTRADFLQNSGDDQTLIMFTMILLLLISTLYYVGKDKGWLDSMKSKFFKKKDTLNDMEGDW